MLDQAPQGGCGTSILQLFKPCTSPETLLQLTDPRSGPSQASLAMGVAPREALGTSLGRWQVVPRQGRGGGRSLEAVGADCQPRELPPCQLPPSPGCTACRPPPHWLLPTLACPRGPALKQACFTGKFNAI